MQSPFRSLIVLFILTFALVLVLSGVEGCAPTSPTAAPTNPAPNLAPTTAPTLSGKIRVAHWEDPSTTEYYNQLLAKFQQQYPNVQVEYVTAPTGQYMDKLNVMLASGDPADVFLAGIGFPYTYQAVQSKTFADLTDNYTRKLKGQLLETAVTPWTVGGKVYGIPIIVETTGNLCFNKKAFDDAKLAYPNDRWTPNDYRAAAQKLVQRDASGKVTRWGALPGADFFYISVYIILKSHDGEAFTPDGKKWVAGLDPFLKKNVEALEPYIAMGGVDKSAPTPSQVRELGFGEGMFERGEVAMRHCGFFLLPLFNKITAFDWGAVVNERWPEHPYVGLTPLALAMSDTSKNKSAAWAFIKFATSPEAQTLQFKLTAQLPSNMQILNSDALTQDAMFKHMDMKAWIKDAMANGRALPGPADTPVAPFSIQGVWEASMDKAWKGDISVEQALKEMQPNMEKLFAKEAGQ